MQKVISFILLYSTFFYTQLNAAIFDLESKGVYGGFWRDLYELGPVVVDTIGADLGIFTTPNLKTGFSLATLVGLLSENSNHDIFDAISKNPYKYNKVLNPLEPADFSYSTVALKLEYLIYDGTIFGWSTTTNLGAGVLGFKTETNQSRRTSISHNYGSLGTAVILKITKNFRMSLGVSFRKDFDANDSSRPANYENFDAISIYNHFYLVKF